MRVPLYLVAGIAVSAIGFPKAEAAMLLMTDPKTDETVIIDTEDPAYRERVIERTQGQDPEGFPEGAWLLTSDQAGNKMVVNPSTDERYYLGRPEGTEAAEGIPEGAFVLSTDPYSDEKQVR